MKTTPAKLYEQYVKDGRLNNDAAQQMVAGRLQELYDRLAAKPGGILSKLFAPHNASAPRGLYIWGEVGRGKSMLMDMFFSTISMTGKQRVHFYSLMLGIHRNIHLLRQKNIEDPLMATARDLAKKTKLLCIDEFQVTDVADAMILNRLFSILLENGVTIVATSNRPPEELYLGGLQREKFLDFVKLVRDRMDILELTSPHDYRMEKIKSLKSVYLSPLNTENETELQNIFENLCNKAEPEEVTLDVQGRKLPVAKACGKTAFFTFSELCEKPLGAADYLAICYRFDTVFLSGIPALSPEKRNEARRFVTLIDSLYDTRTKLICTAAAPPDKIYISGDGTFEFGRTVSRLIEMQSEQYINNTTNKTAEENWSTLP